MRFIFVFFFLLSTQLFAAGFCGILEEWIGAATGRVAGKDELILSFGKTPSVRNVFGRLAKNEVLDRGDAYQKMLANDPKNIDLRTFDTIIIGAGVQGTVLSSNLNGRVLMINDSRSFGTFDTFGHTFFINSAETAAGQSPNIFPGARFQVKQVVDKLYPEGAIIGDMISLNLAAGTNNFIFGDSAVSLNQNRGGKANRFEIKTAKGLMFMSENVVIATGMGKRDYRIADSESLKIIASEQVVERPRITFIDDFMTHNQETALTTQSNPMTETAGQTVIVYGGGDGGAIVVEYLLGLGPSAGYGNQRNVAHLLPKKIIWVGMKATDGNSYKAQSFERYHDIAPFFDNHLIQPYDGKVVAFERRGAELNARTSDNSSFTFNLAIAAAGYSNEVTGFLSGLSDQKVDLIPSEATLETGSSKVQIAKIPSVNSTPIDGVFVIGPAAGGLNTTGEPGGPNSPRIQTMGPRTRAVAQAINARTSTVRPCLVCPVPQTQAVRLSKSNITQHTVLPFSVARIENDVRSGDELNISANLAFAQILSRMKFFYGNNFELILRANQQGHVEITSNDFDAGELQKLSLVIGSDQVLFAHIVNFIRKADSRSVKLIYSLANDRKITFFDIVEN